MVNTFTPFQIDDVAKIKRNELNLEDLDENGQLKPGYYTNTKTAFAELERVVQIESDNTLPVIQPATYWYYNNDINERILWLYENVPLIVPIKNIDTDGLYTLRGEGFIGKSHFEFGVTEDSGNVRVEVKNFMVHNSTTLASLDIEFNLDITGDQNTDNLNIFLTKFFLTVGQPMNYDGNVSDQVMRLLRKEDPVTGNKLPITYFTEPATNILGDRVEHDYKILKLFIRPHARNVDGSVVSTALPENVGNPIVRCFNLGYLLLNEVPTLTTDPEPVTTDQLRVVFSPTRLTFGLSFDNPVVVFEELDVQVNVTSDTFSFASFDFHISRTETSITPIAGLEVSIVPSSEKFNTIRVTARAYVLPRQRQVTGFVLLSLSGSILFRVNIPITVNIAGTDTRL